MQNICLWQFIRDFSAEVPDKHSEGELMMWIIPQFYLFYCLHSAKELVSNGGNPFFFFFYRKYPESCLPPEQLRSNVRPPTVPPRHSSSMPQCYGKGSDMTARVTTPPLYGTPNQRCVESVGRNVGVLGFPAASKSQWHNFWEMVRRSLEKLRKFPTRGSEILVHLSDCLTRTHTMWLTFRGHSWHGASST